MSAAGYERDLYAWSRETAILVREGRFAEIDAASLAAEIESMGKGELRALESRLVVLLSHLLRWVSCAPHSDPRGSTP